jgi:hypothetical protein
MANYTFLVQDIIGATENDGTEFLAYMPKIVNRAEERLTRDLDDYGLVTYTSVAVSAGNNIVTLPVGTRIVKNFNITTSATSTRIHLLQRTDEYIRDYWPVSASTSVPVYYGRRDNTTVLIGPTPVSTYDGEIAYVSRPTTLSSATNTNYFSDFCYDALFNACMVEALVFMKDYNTVQLFEQRYGQSIVELQNRSRRTRRDDMETPASPAGADNPVVLGSN